MTTPRPKDPPQIKIARDVGRVAPGVRRPGASQVRASDVR